MAAAVLAAGGITFAAAGETAVVDSTPGTCDRSTAVHHIGEAKQTLRAGWAKKKWGDRSPVKPAQRREIANHLACLHRGKDRKAIKRYAHERKEAFFLYAEYRSYTPFRCGKGMYSFYAIPCYIIECESHFDWWASNSSGALWIYQLLGWGAPAPVNWAAKVENHRIAHEVSSGSRNFSPWVCA